MTKHNNATFKRIAEQGMVLRTQVGSGLHGVTTGDDDRDEMGVCIEPPEYVIGIQHPPFEQYEFRTQADHHRSGKGDLDLTVYSLRKYVRLAAAGNPTVLLLMHVPEQEIVSVNEIGRELMASKDLFVTRNAAGKFLGYLNNQKARMLGEKSQRTNRPELVDVYGFDTKFAYHMVRLGIQGVEYLTTGNITLPIAEPDRTWLKDLRAGKYTKQDALDRAYDLADQLAKLYVSADLPQYVDENVLNRKLIDWYSVGWSDLAQRAA